MNRSASATISNPPKMSRLSAEALSVAEFGAGHSTLDDLDVPRKVDGQYLSLSQRIDMLRRRLDALRVFDLPPAFGKQIPGGAEGWPTISRS